LERHAGHDAAFQQDIAGAVGHRTGEGSEKSPHCGAKTDTGYIDVDGLAFDSHYDSSSSGKIFQDDANLRCSSRPTGEAMPGWLRHYSISSRIM
jgi:hypothetical protein